MPNPARAQEIEALLNRSFPVPPGKSFYDDFPVWNPRLEIKGVSVFTEGKNAVQACASLRRATLQMTDHSRIQIGILGAVATHPDHRGQGLATHVLEKALSSARQPGAQDAPQAVILWGENTPLYQRLGFQPQGTQLRVGLGDFLARCAPSAPSAPSAPTTETEVFEGFHPEIFRRMQARSDGLVLEDSDFTWISAHKHVRWWQLRHRTTRQLLAYAAAHRGIDLQNHVHEWGGEPDHLTSLLRTIDAHEPGLTLLGPKDTPRRFGLSELPESALLEPCALVLALNANVEPWLPKFWLWGLDAA